MSSTTNFKKKEMILAYYKSEIEKKQMTMQQAHQLYGYTFGPGISIENLKTELNKISRDEMQKRLAKINATAKVGVFTNLMF